MGLRAQLLRQGQHGVDGSVAFTYRQERYIEDGGLLEAVLSVGRSGVTRSSPSPTWSTPGSAEREGEVRAAALLGDARFDLGLQASYHQDLGSTNERRFGRVQPDYELIAGPVATYARSGWVLLVQVGVDALQQQETKQCGRVAVAHIGTSF